MVVTKPQAVIRPTTRYVRRRCKHLETVTKPQAVIRPTTEKNVTNEMKEMCGYKTASGNQAYNHYSFQVPYK